MNGADKNITYAICVTKRSVFILHHRLGIVFKLLQVTACYRQQLSMQPASNTAYSITQTLLQFVFSKIMFSFNQGTFTFILFGFLFAGNVFLGRRSLTKFFLNYNFILYPDRRTVCSRISNFVSLTFPYRSIRTSSSEKCHPPLCFCFSFSNSAFLEQLSTFDLANVVSCCWFSTCSSTDIDTGRTIILKWDLRLRFSFKFFFVQLNYLFSQLCWITQFSVVGLQSLCRRRSHSQQQYWF